MGGQIEERVSRAAFYRDLARGPKRPGWKKEVLQSLADVTKNIGEVSEEEVLRASRDYRQRTAGAGAPLSPKH
jgi:hypothetical protein